MDLILFFFFFLFYQLRAVAAYRAEVTREMGIFDIGDRAAHQTSDCILCTCQLITGCSTDTHLVSLERDYLMDLCFVSREVKATTESRVMKLSSRTLLAV